MLKKEDFRPIHWKVADIIAQYRRTVLWEAAADPPKPYSNPPDEEILELLNDVPNFYMLVSRIMMLIK